jgi:microcystin-dependent protein
VVWLSYADLDGVPSQTAGVSSLLASDWNTYVRDNFDSLKFGHVVVADNTAKSAISAVEGIMVYQSDVDTLFLYNGSGWVKAVDTVSLVDSAVTTAKINDLAVTTAKINDLGVTTGKIAASAVTSAKIADDTIVNADVNSAAAIAYSKLNLASSVTSADIVDNTVVIGDLATALQAFLTPTGTVSAFAGASAPTGYLLCDGSAVSQTTYAALFAVVGANAYGTDGGGNFSLPNLKGRTVIGVGVGTELTGVRGTLQGVKEVTLTGAESGTSAHGHAGSTVGTGVTVTESAHGHPSSTVGTGVTVTTSSHGHIVRASSGGAIVDGNDGLVRGSNIQDPSFSGPIGVNTQSITAALTSGALTIAPNTTGITAALTSGALTIANSTAAAAASAHTNVQPSLPLNYIIKV